MAQGFTSVLAIPLGISSVGVVTIHGCVDLLDWSSNDVTINDDAYYDVGLTDLSNSNLSLVDVVCP